MYYAADISLSPATDLDANGWVKRTFRMRESMGSLYVLLLLCASTYSAPLRTCCQRIWTPSFGPPPGDISDPYIMAGGTIGRVHMASPGVTGPQHDPGITSPTCSYLRLPIPANSLFKLRNCDPRYHHLTFLHHSLCLTLRRNGDISCWTMGRNGGAGRESPIGSKQTPCLPTKAPLWI